MSKVTNNPWRRRQAVKSSAFRWISLREKFLVIVVQFYKFDFHIINERRNIYMANIMDKYSDDEFIKIVQQSFSYKECLFNLGYHSNSGASTNRLKQKIQQLNIDVSHFTSKIPMVRSEENIFIENSTASQKTLRDWYKKGNYVLYVCSICGQEPIWQGKQLTLILDHKNGINNDDRLENLRWVCPNCNQQLPTTGFHGNKS